VESGGGMFSDKMKICGMGVEKVAELCYKQKKVV
jgi:hypothetical protein